MPVTKADNARHWLAVVTSQTTARIEVGGQYLLCQQELLQQARTPLGW